MAKRTEEVELRMNVVDGGQTASAFKATADQAERTSAALGKQKTTMEELRRAEEARARNMQGLSARAEQEASRGRADLSAFGLSGMMGGGGKESIRQRLEEDVAKAQRSKYYNDLLEAEKKRAGLVETGTDKFVKEMTKAATVVSLMSAAGNSFVNAMKIARNPDLTGRAAAEGYANSVGTALGAIPLVGGLAQSIVTAGVGIYGEFTGANRIQSEIGIEGNRRQERLGLYATRAGGQDQLNAIGRERFGLMGSRVGAEYIAANVGGIQGLLTSDRDRDRVTGEARMGILQAEGGIRGARLAMQGAEGQEAASLGRRQHADAEVASLRQAVAAAQSKREAGGFGQYTNAYDKEELQQRLRLTEAIAKQEKANADHLAAQQTTRQAMGNMLEREAELTRAKTRELGAQAQILKQQEQEAKGGALAFASLDEFDQRNQIAVAEKFRREGYKGLTADERGMLGQTGLLRERVEQSALESLNGNQYYDQFVRENGLQTYGSLKDQRVQAEVKFNIQVAMDEVAIKRSVQEAVEGKFRVLEVSVQKSVDDAVVKIQNDAAAGRLGAAGY